MVVGNLYPRTVGAGDSARYEAQQSLLDADELERLAAQKRQLALNYEKGARGEEAVATRLAALESLGWRVLPDRRWGRNANIDFVLVGPGGVVVVDAKNWDSLRIRDGQVFRGDDPVDDEIVKLRDLVASVAERLDDTGITVQAISAALVFAGRKLREQVAGIHLLGEWDVAAWATKLGTRLSSSQIDFMADRLAIEFPAYELPRRARRRHPAPHVPVPLDTATTAEAFFDLDELADALCQNALRGPIEEWMTFLHPDQNRLVRTSWSGPARVRGGAGTGKTVVGLHRAAYLATRQGRRVLFVSFVRTLPMVQRSLCARLAPDALNRIEFTGLHRLAGTILNDAGISLRVDTKKVDNAWARAWLAVGKDSVLATLDDRPAYWKEEVDYVIKGRAIRNPAEYLALARVGRKTPMRVEQREAMWRLYVEYEERLRHAGVHDFNDMLIQATLAVRDGLSAQPYDSIIVDEVQDLNLVGLQMLRQIAGDGADSLLLIGDGQQAIYPGGFTLAEAGIAVTGRATVLRTNYRNTREIVAFAQNVVASDSFDDLEGTSEPGKQSLQTSRAGRPPRVLRHDSVARLGEALVSTLRAEVAEGNSLGDMAVLVETRRQLEQVMKTLTAGGFDVIDLAGYDGHTTNRLRIGTFKRAKGLEFKQVFLPGLRETPPEQWRGESDDAYAERAERHRREVFVGMTRARDQLWVGYLTA